MKWKLHKSLLVGAPLRAIVVPAICSLTLGAGCAHQQTDQKDAEVEQQHVERLESRLEEVERINGRLNVRIEELEDQIFLLQDMTESNRIALKRRGYMKKRGGYLQQPEERAEAPAPAPESYYGDGNAYDDRDERGSRRRSNRDVTRIPLSAAQGGEEDDDGRRSEGSSKADAEEQPAERLVVEGDDDGEHVVIGEDEFRRFSGEAPSKSRKPSRSKKSSNGKAQAPVTNEKLSTSDKDSDTKKGDSEAAGKKLDKPLDVYKQALADYRSGDYADALEGFRAFLGSGPNPNYIDNALYWIGECHFGLGDYEKATDYFKRVLREQPDGNKVPDSMLKMSLAFERLGTPERSRELLEKLTDRYPATNAGRLGAQKLAEMKN
ncbi:MAG: tol-pal system protein YbgF [Persicimonas sp.]